MKDHTLFERNPALSVSAQWKLHQCGKRIYSLNYICGPQVQEGYTLLLVNRGKAVFYGEEEIILKEGNLLLVPPGETLHYRAQTPWSAQWLIVSGKTAEALMKLLGAEKNICVHGVKESRALEKLMDKLYLLSKGADVSSKLSQTGVLYEIFALLLSGCEGALPIEKEVPQKKEAAPQRESKKAEERDRIKEAVAFLDSHFHQEISVEKLAESLGLNPSYLTRRVTERTGFSPKQYVTNKRISKAKELLKTTDASVCEIANAVGFQDQLYFARIFKKMENTTPTDYRKNPK